MDLGNISFALPNQSSFGSIDNFSKVCELNQYAIIEHTQKMPKIAFYIVLVICIILVIRNIVEPWFKEYKYRETVRDEMVNVAGMLSILAVILLFYFTFQYTQEQLILYEKIAVGIMTPLCIFSLWWNRKGIINMFKRFKGED
jgi:quinol-cytochrome oxidoreductase complex cytochrome b subunit